MSYPNRPPVSEILSAMPELAPYGKQAAMLYPVPGAPGIQDSSIGGPLLWPIEDPWPTCLVPDEEDESGLLANAMVPVAQIFARDVPGPWWPAGFDLLQILWCPTNHWEPPRGQADGSPVIELRWRRAADVRDVLTAPPQPVRYDSDDCYTLTPCAITIEPLVDFPFFDELPKELQPRLAAVSKQIHPGGDVITCLVGWKVGGWPTWHVTYPHSYLVPCTVCGTATPLVFTIASDDRVGTNVGRFGELRLFICPEHHQTFQADVY